MNFDAERQAAEYRAEVARLQPQRGTSARAEDQRLAERLAEENLWRSNSLACVRHLVTCHCVQCRAEREAKGALDALAALNRAYPIPHTSRATPPFWLCVVGAIAVTATAVLVSLFLGVAP